MKQRTPDPVANCLIVTGVEVAFAVVMGIVLVFWALLWVLRPAIEERSRDS